MMNQDKSLRLLSKEMRLSLGLTQEELGLLAAVSQDDVDCFERSLPVKLEARQKILKTLCRSMKLQMMSTTVSASESSQLVYSIAKGH